MFGSPRLAKVLAAAGLLSGGAAMAVGAAMIYPPAGLIVAGLFAAALSFEELA